MAKAGFIPRKYKIWIEMRKKLKLSHKHLQMARELGLNAKSLPKLAKTGGSSWKSPLPEYLENLYWKRFKREEPEQVLTVEDLAKRDMAKRAQKKAKKLERQNEE